MLVLPIKKEEMFAFGKCPQLKRAVARYGSRSFRDSVCTISKRSTNLTSAYSCCTAARDERNRALGESETVPLCCAVRCERTGGAEKLKNRRFWEMVRKQSVATFIFIRVQLGAKVTR